jgi:deoxyribodipyrimidine photo-lyase
VFRLRMATCASGAPPAPPARVVLLFRADLRLHDHAALEQACALASASVLPAYVYDPRQWSNCRLLADTPRCGPHRARFVAAAVADLRTRLRRAGSDLAVFAGRTEEVLAALSPDVVLAHAAFTTEERDTEARLDASLRAAGGELRLVQGDTLFSVDALPFAGDLGDLPTSGVTFLKRAHAATVSAAPLLTGLDAPGGGCAARLPLGQWAGHPALHAPSDPFALGMCATSPLPAFSSGGETGGLAALDAFLWRSDAVRAYAATRNELRGGSALSPYLALGCLSPRFVAAELARYDAQRPGAEDSTGAAPGGLLFGLGVQTFFRLSALRFGAALFAPHGPLPPPAPRAWCADAGVLDAWRRGTTGVPLVDAIQRELVQSGHTSNRSRQITASFAVLALGLDWRACAEVFEAQLADYEPSSNAGNWAACTGLVGRENWFSVPKQSRQYDAEGAFIREWVPELARVPLEHLFEPWLMTADQQAACGFELGVTYPDAARLPLRTPPQRSRKP